MTKEEAIKKLDSFSTLQDDWDSYNGETISEVVIWEAIKLVELASKHDIPIYFVSPGRSGDILFDFRNGVLDIEVYINRDRSKELYISNHGSGGILKDFYLEEHYSEEKFLDYFKDKN